MNKKVVMAIVAVVVAVGLFAGGAVAGPTLLRNTGIGVNAAAGPGGAGGPMANLTDEERAQVQNMSDDERQAFFQEKFGGAAPGGGMRSGGRGPGQQVIEGEIAEVAADQLTVKTTAGGSQVVYYDSDTVIAVADGASSAELKAGSDVSVVAASETENILAASIIVLK